MPDKERQSTATKAAVDELKRLIFSGELSADSNHLESELAARLGMSRTPVREAALRLESLGLLQVRPRKGVRISALCEQDMREIYDLLIRLEGHAAARAAMAGYSLRELTGLRGSLRNMEAALWIDDRSAWALADEEFHSELVRLAGNSRLTSIVSMLNDQLRRARTTTLHLRTSLARSNEDHQQLYRAVRLGDSDLACELLVSHRQRAAGSLIELAQQMGLERV
jgi:DNA-binding GntR family transcriptional regulator